MALKQKKKKQKKKKETWAHVIFVLLEKDELVKQMREKSLKNKAYSFRKFNNNLRLFLEDFFFQPLIVMCGI